LMDVSRCQSEHNKNKQNKTKRRWENEKKKGVYINDELIFGQHTQRVELQRLTNPSVHRFSIRRQPNTSDSSR
jgi:hypothetical protein